MWSRERLEHQRAVALGLAIEASSLSSYSSALNSYISFCRSHSFSVEPTADTLSFFIVYTSFFIKPASVRSYLSGICNQLEPYYPDIRTIRKSNIVTRTLTGCIKMRALPTTRKRAITLEELTSLASSLPDPPSYDDELFLAIAFTSFFGLMRLGESVWPDKVLLRDYAKVTRRTSVLLEDSSYSFLLPGHKADRLFEGNRILISSSTCGTTPLNIFRSYLTRRDSLFPLNPELWIREDGTIPLHSWFINRLHAILPNEVSGHSFRAGGATHFALAGVSPQIIQGLGRWKSDTFQIYIRHHPALLAALVFSRNPVSST